MPLLPIRELIECVSFRVLIATDQGYCLDGSSHIGGDDEPSELEYAENEEYLTPPQEGEDHLVPIEIPPPELMIYAVKHEERTGRLLARTVPSLPPLPPQ